MTSTPRKTHIAILASPGMGHIIPSLELAKSLVSHHDLKVTLFVPTTSSSSSESSTPQTQLLTSLSSLPPQDLLNLINLPPVDISNVVPTESHLAIRISAVVRESLPSVRSIIEKSQQQVPTVLITDMFGTDAFEIIGDAFQMSKYLFFTSNLSALAILAYMPKLDPMELMNEPLLRVPGCKPVRVEDLGDSFSYPNCGDHARMVQHARRYVQTSGVLVNTFEDLEPETHRALSDDEIARLIPLPRVYTVGPIIKSAVASPEGPIHCLSWLDMQPHDSVLFVSFGRGGTLSAEQVTELAWGLELSQQRFIWVLRKPNDITLVSSTYLGDAGGGQDDPSEFLPDGFLSRTRGVGLVVPNWAPQVEILSHASIGGFLSHCGWNSTLESIVNGVPMIPWPLFAEQRLNASMLSDDIGVAVRSPIQSSKGVIVGREEIERMVRLVMEGEEGKVMRRRAKELKNNGLGAVAKGGSSYNSLSQLADKWNGDSECGLI
ncbi:UDP-glucuronosyl/UDP-glucosyltransferase [Macleaya cordata]|uniref:Glycosyltransferase n=1 Tax=Macleaya cordata TaxID=56857 RepID=A0A200R7K0_MACCD|nr:UDP-glucuronosyl/UDP-glucosyltransferase [Macleaya cordata]